MIDTWDESLETGNTEIDSQHRELIKLTDELKATEHDSDAGLRILDKIMEFALVHLTCEEELMKEVNYPLDLITEMVEQHREFKSYVRLRILEFRQDRAVSVLPLQAFLDDWLKVHEFGLDRMLVNWIRRQKGTSTTDVRE